MKSLLKSLVYTFILSVACTFSVQAQNSPEYFGEKITEKGAVASNKLGKEMKGKESLPIKLSGKIEQVCKKKGCWMTLDMGNNQKVMIKFKDYGFFVPKDADGRTAVVEGIAKKEVIDVATLRHYAEDAGKSKDEIAKINQPEEKYTFEAIGVIIK